MTTRSEYLRDIPYKLAEWSVVVNDLDTLSRKTPMELENLLDEASRVMMEESHLHKEKRFPLGRSLHYGFLNIANRSFYDQTPTTPIHHWR